MDDLNIDVSIELGAIVDAIATDPVALDRLAQAQRLVMSKHARLIGNLFGPWAQQPTFTNADSNRLK